MKLGLWFFGNVPFVNLCWEILLLHKLRYMHDGITFFELIVNTDFYDDADAPGYIKFSHNPQLTFRLIILNYTIFEFSLYTPANQNND